MSGKSAFISDLHIKMEGDDASKVLMSFLSHPKVQESENIYLLGDIFDFLVGEHKSYISEYPKFFKEILRLNKEGKNILFIEGNHDFHFSKILKNYLRKNLGDSKKFFYQREGSIISFGRYRVFVCHGHEIDYYNKYFKRWYRIYSSFAMNILVSYFLPFKVLKCLANWASKDSKRRGKKTFDYSKMKKKYRLGVQALINEKKVDGVIGGHTHIPEFMSLEDKSFYYNVGFPLRDQHFLYFDGEVFQKIEFN